MSGFLLDTNIPSELTRARPEKRVADGSKPWKVVNLFLSVMTLGEIRKGFVTARDPVRRTFLERWFETELLPWFEGRILPVTRSIAEKWGELDGQCQLRGAPLNTADGLLAATALQHGLTLATRNVRDFADLDVRIFNPWQQT